MNIKIKRRVNPYAQIDRDLINDPELSPQSLGVLVYLLSKPEGWKPAKAEILARFSNSTVKFTLNALENVLRELRKAGYAKITHIPGPNGTIYGTEYVISEVPEFKSTEVAISSEVGKSPSVGNVGGYSNKESSSKEELSNKERLSNSENGNGNFEKAKASIDAHFEIFPDTWKVVCASARLQLTKQDFDFELEKWLRWNEKNIPMMQTITKYITGGPSSLFSWLSRKKEQAYREALKPARPTQPQQAASYTKPAEAPAPKVGNNRDLL